jgi:hypothetical protein
VDPGQLPGARVRAPPVGAAAEQGGAALALQQLDKATWLARVRPAGRSSSATGSTPSTPRFAPPSSTLARLLQRHRICLRVEGHEASPHALALAGLPDGWESRRRSSRCPGGGAHEFGAADYDTLVDHPVELGRFWRGRFDAAGVAHEFVVAGAWPDFDGERLLADTKRICEAAIRFWHGERARAVRALPLHAQRARGRPRRARASLEHGAGRAAPRPAAPRSAEPARRPAKAERATATSASSASSPTSISTPGTSSGCKPREFARFDYAARTTPGCSGSSKASRRTTTT